MSNRSSNSWSQRSSWMSNSIVRLALVTSVACTLRPVRFQMSQLSTVPKSRRPSSARARASSVLSSSHLILLAEKYASGRRPVVRMIFSMTSGLEQSSSIMGAVRRHCQTMAFAMGRPVSRSHSMVVSRWLVMPMLSMSRAVRACEVSKSVSEPSCEKMISWGFCSTHPGCGYIWGNLR